MSYAGSLWERGVPCPRPGTSLLDLDIFNYNTAIVTSQAGGDDGFVDQGTTHNTGPAINQPKGRGSLQ